MRAADEAVVSTVRFPEAVALNILKMAVESQVDVVRSPAVCSVMVPIPAFSVKAFAPDLDNVPVLLASVSADSVIDEFDLNVIGAAEASIVTLPLDEKFSTLEAMGERSKL